MDLNSESTFLSDSEKNFQFPSEKSSNYMAAELDLLSELNKLEDEYKKIDIEIRKLNHKNLEHNKNSRAEKQRLSELQQKIFKSIIQLRRKVYIRPSEEKDNETSH